MKAAETIIRIRATTESLARKMEQGGEKMVEGGEKAAKSFSDKFNEYLDRTKGQLAQKLQKAIEPGAIIGGLQRAIDAVASGGGLFGAFDALLSSVPIFGSAYNLGKSIGNAIAKAISDDDEIAAALKKQTDEMTRYVEQRNREQQFLDQQGRQIRGARGSLAMTEFDVSIQQERAAGNERQALFLEMQKQRASIEQRLNEQLIQAKSEDEKNLLRQNAQLEKDLAERGFEERFSKIQQREAQVNRQKREEEDRRAREMGDDAVKLFQEEQKEQERLAKEAERDAERLAKKKQQYDEEAMRIDAEFEQSMLDAQKAGIGSGQTALGTFKFDTYTDEQKRKNDEDMLKELKRINTGLVGSFGFT